MKKACLIFAAVFCMSAAQAQFCNMEKGTVLLYVNEDREANEVKSVLTPLSFLMWSVREMIGW